MRSTNARPRGHRELTLFARVAAAAGLFLLSTTPASIQTQIVVAETGPAIDYIHTGTVALAPSPEQVNREVKAGQPPIDRGQANAGIGDGSRGAFFFATGHEPIAAAYAPAIDGRLSVALSALPHSLIDSPSPSDGVAAAAFDPDAPIAYADPGGLANFDAPFNALINPLAKPELAVNLPNPATDHDWVANPVPNASRSAAEKRCLAEGIYFEARSEPIRGQLAVAQVVVNRLKNPAYPDSICGVVYQNRQYRNACQFSFACDGIREVIRDYSAWETAQQLAAAVLDGEAIYIDEIGSATHYHATYVRPNWARSMERMAQIGVHVFYRTYGGGWI